MHSGGPPAPGGYGAPAPGGYGSPPPTGGYGAPAPGGYGAPAPGGYGAPAPGGYGAPAPGGYGAPAPGGYGGGVAPRDDYKRPFHKGGQHVLGRDRCPFYHKMGACRHGDRCTKVHDKPTSSRTIVLPMMFPNPKIVPIEIIRNGRKVQVEYDRKLLKKHIEEFYEDVFCTVMEFGRIVEMRVVDNLCEHMLGNVYIKFENEVAAQNAVDGLNGKMYNGILLLPELCPVSDFADAICKEVDDVTCKRGIQCNYWHPTPYPKSDSSLLRDLARAQEAHWSKLEKKRDRERSPLRRDSRDRDSPSRRDHRREDPAADQLCHICGRTGHPARECPLK